MNSNTRLAIRLVMLTGMLAYLAYYLQDSSPIQDSVQTKHSSPIQDSVQTKHSSPVQDSVQTKHSSPIQDSVQTKHSSPIQDSVQTKHSSPIQDSAQTKHSSPIQDSVQTKHSSPIQDSVQTKHSSPIQESVQTKHSSSIQDSVQTKHSFPIQDSALPKHSSPIQDSAMPKHSSSIQDSAKPKHSSPIQDSAKSKRSSPIQDSAQSNYGALTRKAGEVNEIERDTHQARLAHLKGFCNQKVNRTDQIPWKLLFSQKDHLACKRSAKIGSTFMTQLFSLLNRRGTMDIFTQSRGDFHGEGIDSSFKREFTVGELENYKVMIMARNPYSRLYSAYIDKVFLANSVSLVYNVYKHSSKMGDNSCKFNISFQSFLNYAVKGGHRALHGHYKPLISKDKLDMICKVPHVFIVKQETFSSDVEYALNNYLVSRNTLDKVHAILYQKNAESNVHSLSKVLYSHINGYLKRRKISRKDTKDCFGWNIVAERLWESFKIQGYIRDKAEFPKNKFRSKTDFKDVDYIIKIAVDELRRHPLSSEEKLLQRKRHLLNAFRGISDKTMKKIKIQYAKDFEVFEYEKELL